MMSANELQKLCDLANELADLSGRVIRSYFRKDIFIDQKMDQTPVTVADREAELAIREHLASKRPKDGVIGEELSNIQINSEYVWVLDPIDGTKSFISGRPIFGTLIALVQGGSPILGVIDQPILHERWMGAKNCGTTFNNSLTHTRPCRNIADASIATTSPDSFNQSGKKHWNKITSEARNVLYGGDCYSFAQLAFGQLDAVIEFGTKSYDFCALVPVINEAGGHITDWGGKPLTLDSDGSILACGDKELHDQLLEILNV
tara:strand:+ start:979 stop:1761 length:783 start_codon:yes stop_codon:yes gene_type:complete